MRPALFDRYVVVDWSAAGRPRTGRDSVWVCSLGREGRPEVCNPPTRRAAAEVVRAGLVRAVEGGRPERVLVGFDFPYGYPDGFARALGLEGVPWRATWTHLRGVVRDDGHNRSNRFEVAAHLNARLGHHAFWGCPPASTGPALSPRRDRVSYAPHDGWGLREWRVTEQVLLDRGRRPHPVWKLLGAGSVGSQSLVGIPTLHGLRFDPVLEPFSRVWPFEIGAPEAAARPLVVHAEVWPSLIDVRAARRAPGGRGEVRDEVQVTELAAELRRLDRAGALAALLAAAPAGAKAEEGWILGAVPVSDARRPR